MKNIPSKVIKKLPFLYLVNYLNANWMIPSQVLGNTIRSEILTKLLKDTLDRLLFV